MKRRITGVILVVVMLVLALASCAYSIAEDDMIVDSAYVYTKNIDEDSAGIGVDIEFTSRLPKRIVTVQVKDPDGSIVRKTQKYVAEKFVRMAMDIRAPRLWWPIGHGAQPMYTLEILDGEKIVHACQSTML